VSPLNDHTLLLQLERQYDVLEERVKGVEDIDNDYCDCSCHEADVSHLEDLIEQTDKDHERDMAGLRSDLDALNDAIQELREKYVDLIHTLRGRGIPA